MPFRFASSAHKHGIGHERAAYVIEHCGLPYEGLDGDSDAVLFLGEDWNGVHLEVGAIELEGGDLLVIHAMKLRRKYRGRFEEALPWRR
jgi:hypothetical protein